MRGRVYMCCVHVHMHRPLHGHMHTRMRASMQSRMRTPHAHSADISAHAATHDIAPRHVTSRHACIQARRHTRMHAPRHSCIILPYVCATIWNTTVRTSTQTHQHANVRPYGESMHTGMRRVHFRHTCAPNCLTRRIHAPEFASRDERACMRFIALMRARAHAPHIRKQPCIHHTHSGTHVLLLVVSACLPVWFVWLSVCLFVGRVGLLACLLACLAFGQLVFFVSLSARPSVGSPFRPCDCRFAIVSCVFSLVAWLVVCVRLRVFVLPFAHLLACLSVSPSI